MSWPDPADYQDAIQNPQVCFKDPELKKGSVGVNRMGLPRVAAGNFASVYEVKNGSHRWAVRCFIRQVSDQHRRYSLLSQHLAGFILPCVVGFDYLDEGILVRGQWYPIVKMEWVEGDSLTTYIKKKVNDRAALINLSRRWRGLVNSLRGNHLAHGDLQHGNVLVTPQGELKLVDYDAMFVPSLRGERSPELGHANYQHPLREAGDYDEDLDNFSALVIYVSLQALAEDAGLWQLNTGENLVLSAPDYKLPKHSTAFQRLKKNPNKVVSELASELEHCCVSSVDQVPVFEEVVANTTYAGGSRPLPRSKPSKPSKQPKPPAKPKGSTRTQPPVQPAQTGTPWYAQPAPAPAHSSVAPAAPVVPVVPARVIVIPKIPGKINVKWIGVAAAVVVLVALTWYLLTPGTVDYSKMEGGPVLAAHSSLVRCLAFSKDGETLASVGEDGRIKFWDIETRTVKTTKVTGSNLTMTAAFSRDGKLVATGGGGIKDGSTYGEVKVWEFGTGNLKWEYQKQNQIDDLITCAAFSPDSRLLATGVKGLKIIIWDAEKGGAPLATLRGTSQVTSLAFSPDAKSLVTGGGDNRGPRYGEVRVWDWQGNKTKWFCNEPKEGHGDMVNWVTFSPDGKTVASASDDTMIFLWDAEETKANPRKFKLRGPEKSAKWVGFSPDGNTVLGASADGTLRFWDAQTGQIKPPQKLDNGKAIASAAMSPNGRTIATGDEGGGLKVWFAK